jgi:hypothetical protein
MMGLKFWLGMIEWTNVMDFMTTNFEDKIWLVKQLGSNCLQKGDFVNMS